jgi:hypothetical protein
MITTGFMLWNPIATAKILPGTVIPMAKAMHSNEAVLAVLVIIVWHFYHVHISHWNKSIFTGYMSREEMLEEHPLELAAVESGEAQDRIPPPEVKRREKIFFPVYGAIAAVFLVGIYLFVTFEETAIGTIEPPEQVAIYAPIEIDEPPVTSTSTTVAAATTTSTTVADSASTTTVASTSAVSWDSEVSGLLAGGCGGCHSAGNPMGGLDVTSYEAAAAGGAGGPGIVPGDPDASQIFVVQAAGGHPRQFTDEEINTLRAWIEAGAPE